MTSLATTFAHQSTTAGLVPAGWTLEAGRALTLRPKTAGVLRVTQGRVWVTIDALRDDVQASGDLFLMPGRGLVVRAGQRLVIESSDTDRHAHAHFNWDPLSQAQTQCVPHAVGQWQRGVVQPVRDLGLALGHAGLAVARLGQGVAGLVFGALTGRLRATS